MEILPVAVLSKRVCFSPSSFTRISLPWLLFCEINANLLSAVVSNAVVQVINSLRTKAAFSAPKWKAFSTLLKLLPAKVALGELTVRPVAEISLNKLSSATNPLILLAITAFSIFWNSQRVTLEAWWIRVASSFWILTPTDRFSK